MPKHARVTGFNVTSRVKTTIFVCLVLVCDVTRSSPPSSGQADGALSFDIVGGYKRWQTQCTYDFYSQKDNREGRFSSPFYPQSYLPGSKCQYIFYGQRNEKVRIHFAAIRLGQSNASCSNNIDYISIRDGIDPHSPIIAEICNDRTTVDIESRTENLVVELSAIGQRLSPGRGRGFEATFSFISPQSFGPIGRAELVTPKNIPSTTLSVSALHMDATVNDEATSNIATCRRDLGMHSMAIPNSSITASSSYDEKNVGPLNSRIRMEMNGGAWCPRTQIARDVYEWLQIDLGELKVISMVETQGRFGNGQGQEFATNYRLEYQRQEGGRWFRYKNHNGTEVLRGNVNTYIPELRELRPPIVARWVRFVPHSNHLRTVCMRVELFGCTWTDGVVSYSMRQGDRRGTDVDFADFTYDGDVIDGRLSGGLGQLTDTEEGFANFRLHQSSSDGGNGASIVARRRGYEWVAWRSDEQQRTTSGTANIGVSTVPPVVIHFAFDGIRRITGLRIHSHNSLSRDVAVFRAAELHFYLDDDDYEEDDDDDENVEISLRSSEGTGDRMSAVYFEHQRDTTSELPRHVAVPIPDGGRIARYARLVLHFDMRWIMVSEVRFDSQSANDTTDQYDYDDWAGIVSMTAATIATDPSTERTAEMTTSDYDGVGGRGPVVVEIDLFKDDQGDGSYSVQHGIESEATDSRQSSLPDWSSQSTMSSAVDHGRGRGNLFLAILLGTAGAFVVVAFIVGVVLLTACHRRRRGMLVVGSNRRGGKCGAFGGGFGHESGALLRPALVANSVSSSSATPSPPQRSNGGSGTRFSVSYLSPLVIGAVGNEAGKSATKGGNAYSSVSTSDALERVVFVGTSKMVGNNDVDAQTSRGRLGNMDSVAELKGLPSPPITRHSGVNALPSSGRSPSLSDDQQSTAAEDTSLIHVDDVTKSYMSSSDVDDEFPRSWMKYIEKIGDGMFGEVYICEVLRTTESAEEDGRIRNAGPVIIAVKTLRVHASQQDRKEFENVVKTMSVIDDCNVVRMLGVCRKMEPLCILMEYPACGDLHQFLLQRVFNDGLSSKNTQHGPPSLSYGCLLHMATQIASGMKYLAELGIVHRDLAARNCLIGSQLKVKVADFGLTAGANGCRYAADYFRLDDETVLPVRWSAIESIVRRQYTSRSDVWSFGVTLWELMGFARGHPFDWLSDSQLVRNYVVSCSPSAATMPLPRLPQPRVCPREIYDLMLECWNVDGSQRPTFREIHMFLTRKGIGFRHAGCENVNEFGSTGFSSDIEWNGNDNAAISGVDLMG